MKKKWIIRALLALVILMTLMLWATPFLKNPPFPVPEAATRVRYKSAFIPGPGGKEWAAFHLPDEKCKLAAIEILNYNISPAEIRQVLITAKKPISKIDGPWWFNPHRIKNGILLYRNLQEPFSPTVWIDSEKGIVYYHTSD